jgi:hypothetical protein
MTEENFKLEVIGSLSELKTDVSAIKTHLATLNGKVLRHSDEIAETTLEIARTKLETAALLARHSLDCSTKSEMSEVRAVVVADKEKVIVHANKLELLTKVMGWILGATAILLLLHASEVLKFFKIG